LVHGGLLHRRLLHRRLLYGSFRDTGRRRVGLTGTIRINISIYKVGADIVFLLTTDEMKRRYKRRLGRNGHSGGRYIKYHEGQRCQGD
jgi:hypothetical protein